MKSVVTDYDKCFFCGDTATEEHHLIFGTSGRAFSEKYGLKVGICPKCHTRSEYVTCRIHDNVKAEQLSLTYGWQYRALSIIWIAVKKAYLQAWEIVRI